MISVEEKIQIFRQELQDRFFEKKKKELAEVEKSFKEDQSRQQDYIETELAKLNNRYQKLENRNVTKIINEAKNKAKELGLILDNDLFADLLESVKENLKKELNSKLYEDFYKRSVDEIKPYLDLYPDFIVFTRKQDRTSFLNLTKLDPEKVDFKDLDEDRIGGFILMDGQKRIRFDLTLLELLEENQRQIGHLFNQKLGEISGESSNNGN